jgi:group I intron endonuclease
MKISGIYKIINRVNGKYYVGSSNDITSNVGRWYEHRYMFKNKTHHNKHLQNAWYKNGENNFDFIIMEECSSDRRILLDTEQKYLDIARQEPNMTYNKTFIAGSLEMTDEIKQKISKANKGKRTGKYNIATPTDIVPEAKKIWIESGRTKLDEYLRSLGYKWGIIERLISIFKLDIEATKERKKNFSKNHKRFSKNLKWATGKSHYKYNSTIHRFKNNITLKEFVGTQREFINAHPEDKHCVRELIRRKSQSSKNWILLQ